MSRILKAYDATFRSALLHFGARRLQKGVELLSERARRLSVVQRVPIGRALVQVYSELLAKRGKHILADGVRDEAPVFLCDAGLGGLARWLRAAGYEARWRADIDDDELVREAEQTRAIMLTTDSLLMERRVVRGGQVQGFWLPPILSVSEQLSLIFSEFNLKRGEPRCMSCGGVLRPGDKEALRDRIPPRTYRWLDEYFVCSRCHRLFWRGTHWEKIRRELDVILVEAGKTLC